MKNLLTIIAAMLFFSFIVLPSIASAQPAPSPGYEYYCYYVVFPYPHSQCELRIIEYRVLPPPSHRRYIPGPRPMNRPPLPRGSRGHHPPPNHNSRR